MSAEIWLAIRDAIGERTSVDCETGQVLIKNLPAGRYDVLRHGSVIIRGEGPNRLPNLLLYYLEDRYKAGEDFPDINNLRRIPDIISEMELSVISV